MDWKIIVIIAVIAMMIILFSFIRGVIFGVKLVQSQHSSRGGGRM